MFKFIKFIIKRISSLTLNLFLLFIILSVIGMIATSSKTPDLPDNGYLYIPMAGLLTEEPPETYPEFDALFEDQIQVNLIKLRKIIHQAAMDEDVLGIFLDWGLLQGGLAKRKELRNILSHFKASEKKIIVYAKYLSEPDYYLASIADEIYLHPLGELEFNGLSAQVIHYKNALKKLGIQAQVFKVGQFKSAIEPFIQNEMSLANKKQLTSILKDLRSTLYGEIANELGFSIEKIEEISRTFKVRNAKDALDQEMITELMYKDEVIKKLKANKALSDPEKLFIPVSSYPEKSNPPLPTSPHIAVVMAEGDILPGYGTDGQIGSDRYANIIRKLRKNKNVKAIVLRINSPGGSMLASDVIWRELKITSKEKPVIASMADIAASGGYYLAMACDEIIAQPTTITGSIGIFAILFNAENLLVSKLGLTPQTVKTDPYADFPSFTRPLQASERSILQNSLNRGYDIFITKAAEGRGLKKFEIEKVAQGRVWTGNQALQIGLVDRLGGLNDAIAVAKEKADTKAPLKIHFYPKIDLFNQFRVSLISAKNTLSESQLSEKKLKEIALKKAEALSKSPILARMPVDILIK